MTRSVLAAVLTPVVPFSAAIAPAGSEPSDGRLVAGVPMPLDLLQEALERNREGKDGRAAAVGRWNNGRISEAWRGRHGPGIDRHLPDRCYEDVRTRGRTVGGYGIGCMHASAARPGDLPRKCIARFRETRTFHDARCLRSQGWTSRAARR